MELSFPATHARFVVQRQSVHQSNKTLEAVNIIVHSVVSHFANMDQEPSCSSTGIPTDDESPYVLVAFMICIALKDVCIHSLLLMKKAVTMC
jgi:hypothetical protein